MFETIFFINPVFVAPLLIFCFGRQLTLNHVECFISFQVSWKHVILLKSRSRNIPYHKRLFISEKFNLFSDWFLQRWVGGLRGDMGQGIQEWTKWNLSKTAFKHFYLVNSWMPWPIWRFAWQCEHECLPLIMLVSKNGKYRQLPKYVQNQLRNYKKSKWNLFED